jgi:Ca2+-transporting ATPase
MVIEDDDLEHLIRGVADGRTILANIRKSIHFLLATNLSEIIVVFAEILRGPAELESPMELFWINLVTDVFPSLGLALEPSDPDVLLQPPRRRDDPLIDTSYYRRLALEGGVIGATTLVAHAYGLSRYGPGPRTRGLTFLAMVSAQLLHALTCRSDRWSGGHVQPIRSNPALMATLALSAGLQALPFMLPPLRRLLNIAPLGPTDLLVAAATSGASYLTNELLVQRRRRPPPGPDPVEPESGEASS